MTGKEVAVMVAVSAATSLVVVGVVLYVALRQPLPLIDTSDTKAVFAEQAQQAKAA